jgi:hypothetical protein
MLIIMRKLRNPVIDGHKKCGICNTIKPIDAFYMKKSLHGEIFPKSKCKECTRAYAIRRNRSLGVQSNKCYPIIDGSKQCTICDKVKPIDQFGKHSRNISGIRCHCIECELERNLKYRRAKGAVPNVEVAHPIINSLKQCYICNENLAVKQFSVNKKGYMKHSCRTCNLKKDRPLRHKYYKRDSEQLTDEYLGMVIRKHIPIKKKDIPEDIFHVFREKIKLQRELRQLKSLNQ